MTTHSTAGGRTAPEHIWAEVRGGGVIMPECKKYVALLARSYQEPNAIAYVRLDVVSDALMQARGVLSCILDPEARADRDAAIAAINAALAKTGGAA